MSNFETVTIENKVIVGLTGNISTGKSAVLRLAADKDALTIDADKIVHELMDSDTNLQAALAVAFGSEVRKANGRIDRRALGKVVFSDPEALKDLEAMTHPLVRLEIGKRILGSEAPIVFIEAIKLLEGDLVKLCHQIWVTRCSKQRQLERLVICRGMDVETATNRINAQPPQEEKVAFADVVFDTGGPLTETESQFELAWSHLPDPLTAAPKAVQVPLAPKPVPAEKTESGEKTAEKPREVKKLSRESAKLIKLPPRPTTTKPAAEATAPKPEVAKTPSPPSPYEERPKDRPEDLQVRRARPSDVPSIILLIQRATEGAVKMKRSDLLSALSERSYFIGQKGVDIQVIIGMNIDYQVVRMDQIFMYPLDEVAMETGTAVLEDIERSARMHIAELMVGFLRQDTPAPLRHLFESQGYTATEKSSLPRTWQMAIDESQPADTFLMTKVLKDDRLIK